MEIDRGRAMSVADLARLDGHTMCSDLVELGLLRRVATGELPHTSTVSLDYPVAPADLVDERLRVTRSAGSDAAMAVLAEGEDWALSVRVRGTSTVMRIAATTRDQAQALAEQLSARVSRPLSAETMVRVWNGSSIGVSVKNDRAIHAPTWDQIADNYPVPVRAQLEELHQLTRPVGLGKLILWHGEPGTGKTTAARSLFRSWADWCSVEYITDPERFFDDPSYITEVISRPSLRSARPSFDHIGDHETSWRLIVAEDADEQLRAGRGPAHRTGLARLLNLADGVLGQGVNSLILLTTNEPVDSLHPALVRPGRALANISFTRFSAADAGRWLDTTISNDATAMTLAEMFHHQRPPDSLGISAAVPRQVGQYL